MQLAAGALKFHQTNFTNNTAALVGGALLAYPGVKVRCSSCSFTQNSAGGSGGAAAGIQALLNISNSRIIGNTALGSVASVNLLGLQPGGVGGGFFMLDSDLLLTGSEVSGNKALLDGGGVVMVDGRLEVDRASVLSGNQAGNMGGAILVLGSKCQNVSSSTTKKGTRGKASVAAGHLVQSATFSNNSARLGGALAQVAGHCNSSVGLNQGVQVVVSGGVFNGNQADEGGGAVFVSFSSHLVASDVRFAGNLGGMGGSVFCSSCLSVSISSSNFSSNRAFSGGALCLSEAQQASSISNSTFKGNVALLQPLSEQEASRLATSAGIATSTDNSSTNSMSVSSLRGTVAPKGVGRVNWTALVAPDEVNWLGAPQVELNRWPTCGDYGSGGALCVSPSSGRILLNKLHLKGNNGLHGGK
jgi:hypothetical protein